ncbi:MFS transporter [Tomitella fengzijianii]|uniref:MFS transporter n=1 Tax=Tomitella fengzijianii TaxID=2597660 RepID=UPI0018EF27EF|nr:MFS transporter [Tomitella fengzijianii]
MSAVIVGFLAARVSTKWILLVMAVAWAVLQFPMLLGGGAAVLLVSRILLGGAEGPATPISLQHAHGWFAARERGLPSNLVAMGSTLGPIVAAPALAWIIANPALGWRWAFGILGIVGLRWSTAWFLLGRDGPYSHTADAHGDAPDDATDGATADHDENAETPVPLQASRVHGDKDRNAGASIADAADQLATVPVFRALGTRMFIIAVLAGAGCFWALGFLTTWAPRYISAVADLSPTTAGTVFTAPWVLGAVALLFLGYASRFLMLRGVTVRWALGALFGASLKVSGLGFLLLPHVSGVTAIVVMTVAAGLAMIYPMAPITVAFCVCSRQRAALMATLTALASLGGVVSPWMVGHLMDSAGFAATPKGEPVPAAMTGALLSGMNSAFWMIGVDMLIVGAASVVLLNPDRTARRLQKFAFHG